MILPTLKVIDAGGSPVELPTFKNAIKRSDDAYDANLTGLLETATDLIENHCNRALKTQTLCYVLPDRCMNVGPKGIELRPPLQDINSVTCVDTDAGTETVVDDDIYYFDIYSEPGRLVLKDGQSWSDLDNPYFRISFDCGYGADADVPYALKHAVLLLAAHLYVEGMNLQTTELPPEIAFIVGPYVIVKV